MSVILISIHKSLLILIEDDMKKRICQKEREKRLYTYFKLDVII